MDAKKLLKGILTEAVREAANERRQTTGKQVTYKPQAPTYKKSTGTGIDKGMFGEFKIETRIKGFSPNHYFVRNCYVPKGDGTTTEIDTVMIHETGIYVFESKNYGGYIFGSENNRNWTVTYIASHGQVEKHRFYNPIMQNRSHMNALKKYLAVDVPMFSYVVFSEKCTFKDVTYNKNDVTVCKCDVLSGTLGRDINYRPNVLSKEQMRFLFMRIEPLANKSAIEKINHIRSVNERINK